MGNENPIFVIKKTKTSCKVNEFYFSNTNQTSGLAQKQHVSLSGGRYSVQITDSGHHSFSTSF